MNNLQLVNDLRKYHLFSEKVLKAFEKFPREIFVPEEEFWQAYENHPVPIGYQQTISQPYIVARMTDLLVSNRQNKFNRILEIGTGSGYQAAILSEFAKTVYTIERILPLYQSAQKHLSQCQIQNVKCFYGDGHKGLPEFAPFDAIILTAATESVPKDLLEQLRDKGKLLLPLGGPHQTQRLQLLIKNGKTIVSNDYDWVSFVPMRPDVE